MIAFDSNILIYAEGRGDSQGRHARASSMLARAGLGRAIVPVQVLGEFANVCRKKSLLPAAEVAAKVAQFAIVFEAPQTRPSDVTAAAVLADQAGIQFFDALIAIVASQAGAKMLLSEDMQDGSVLSGLRILNPFNSANDAAIAAALAGDSD